MALLVGISPLQFGEMTIGQVLDVVDAHNRQQESKTKEAEARFKDMAMLLHWHAELCAYAFNDPKKMPSIEASFPTLFAKSDGAHGQSGGAPEWKRQQAGFAAWVNAYNNRHKGGRS